MTNILGKCLLRNVRVRVLPLEKCVMRTLSPDLFTRFNGGVSLGILLPPYYNDVATNEAHKITGG